MLFFLAVASFGFVGSSVFNRLDSGGYSDPNSESAKVSAYLEDKLHITAPAVAVIVRSTGSVNDPAIARTGMEIERKLAKEPSAKRTLSYWSTGHYPALRSTDGKSAVILVYLKTTDFNTIASLGAHYLASYSGKYKNVELLPAGTAILAYCLNAEMKQDIRFAESIAVPLTFVLLLYIFGAVVASAMPTIIGLASVLGAFFLLYITSLVTDVSIFAVNLVTGLGLGLGIDYALLIVNRFREELHKGQDVETSVVNTLLSAGKTVFFSGVTLVVTLVALTFFPQPFMKSMGYAGVSVVALAVACALIALPAILALLGRNVDLGKLHQKAIFPELDGPWASLARLIMRRPIPVVVISLGLLSLFIAPMTHLKFGQVDARVLPRDNPAAASARFISENFTGQEAYPIEIVIPNGMREGHAITVFADRVRAVPGIVRVVNVPTGGDDVRLMAIEAMPPRTAAAQDLIHELRALPKPVGTLVGGSAADYTDTQDATAATLPWVAVWIACGIVVLLFVFTGSIVLPIEAVLLNVASTSAMIGVLTWIFIDGNFRWLVGDFTITGTLDTETVILITVVAFGVSMDYELFLLSRIKEEHDGGHSNVESVARGLQRSARIITSAALLLSVAFGVFCVSGVTSIKMLGVGAAFAILVDATLIRAILVPALMRLIGDWNWWAPRALKRLMREAPCGGRYALPTSSETPVEGPAATRRRVVYDRPDI